MSEVQILSPRPYLAEINCVQCVIGIHETARCPGLIARDFGGTRNGTVIRWPNGVKDKGGLRTQFSHVIDIAPTIVEAAGLPQPKSVNGTVQTPIEGVSMVYTFDNAKAPERHKTQYFEMFGNRAIYHDGWLARTIHRAPWQTSAQKPLLSDVWDLYDVRNDFSLSANVAAAQPAKLKQMQALFMKEAEKYHVLPIDDRTIERTNPALAGRQMFSVTARPSPSTKGCRGCWKTPS